MSFLGQQIAALSHRPWPGPLPRQHECEDSAFTQTSPASDELALMGGRMGRPVVFARDLFPFTLPSCSGACATLLPRLPPQGWVTPEPPREPLSPNGVVSLFSSVCGSAAWEGERNLLSVPAGSALELGPGGISFCSLLSKAKIKFVCACIL